MNRSSSENMEIPTIEDFEILKDAFVELSSSDRITVKRVSADIDGLSIRAEKLCADVDFLAWPLYTICLSGISRTYPEGSSLVVRYREFSHHAITKNSSINHDYILKSEFDELVVFGHSITVHPEIKPPATDIEIIGSDFQLNEVAEGARILKINTGNQLELTSGDCGILFDRMVNLME